MNTKEMPDIDAILDEAPHLSQPRAYLGGASANIYTNL